MALSWTVIFACAIVLPNLLQGVNSDTEDAGSANVDSAQQLPTVFIPLLVRNKAHTLVTFFGCLERLNYPKDRISIWWVITM